MRVRVQRNTMMLKAQTKRMLVSLLRAPRKALNLLYFYCTDLQVIDYQLSG
jgi:hypothetical protein